MPGLDIAAVELRDPFPLPRHVEQAVQMTPLHVEAVSQPTFTLLAVVGEGWGLGRERRPAPKRPEDVLHIAGKALGYGDELYVSAFIHMAVGVHEALDESEAVCRRTDLDSVGNEFLPRAQPVEALALEE